MSEHDLENHAFGFSTEQVHAGYQYEKGFGARITPLYLSAGFVFDDFEHAKARFAGDDVQVLAVDRHGVTRGAHELGRGGPDPGGGLVVGVAVDALLVVVHQGVGALGIGELGDAAGQLEGVPRGQRPAGARPRRSSAPQ